MKKYLDRIFSLEYWKYSFLTPVYNMLEILGIILLMGAIVENFESTFTWMLAVVLICVGLIFKRRKSNTND